MKPKPKLFKLSNNIFIIIKNIFYKEIKKNHLPKFSVFVSVKLFKTAICFLFTKFIFSFHHLRKQKYTAKKFIIDDG